MNKLSAILHIILCTHFRLYASGKSIEVHTTASSITKFGGGFFLAECVEKISEEVNTEVHQDSAVKQFHHILSCHE